MTLSSIHSLRIGTFFMGTTSIRDGSMYVGSQFEAQTKLALIDVSDRVVPLADSSKFQRPRCSRSRQPTASMSFITDRGPAQSADHLRRQGVDVVLVHAADEGESDSVGDGQPRLRTSPNERGPGGSHTRAGRSDERRPSGRRRRRRRLPWADSAPRAPLSDHVGDFGVRLDAPARRRGRPAEGARGVQSLRRHLSCRQTRVAAVAIRRKCERLARKSGLAIIMGCGSYTDPYYRRATTLPALRHRSPSSCSARSRAVSMELA